MFYDGSIQDLFNEFYNKSGIKKDVRFKVIKGDSLNGRAFRGEVGINKSVLKILNTETGLAVSKHLLGHELAHIKHNDSEALFNFYNFTMFVPFTRLSKLVAAKSIIQEIRADISGRSISGINENEVEIAHKAIQKSCKSYTKLWLYILGYPTREQRIFFESKYKVFSDEALDDIMNTLIKDFCKVRKIKDFNTFVKDLKNFL